MRPSWSKVASLAQKSLTPAIFSFASVFIALKGHSF